MWVLKANLLVDYLTNIKLNDAFFRSNNFISLKAYCSKVFSEKVMFPLLFTQTLILFNPFVSFIYAIAPNSIDSHARKFSFSIDTRTLFARILTLKSLALVV
ncbi:hypothetical protein EGR_09874 [Echinococcus granulosus]|uniref:Uncharacterized protein n=1 Tax=Echinococcus granulosus TaxID=6210 RepID=W6U2I1_ECHGR|nr:hypothetical protein EGR_09874 [Echinococcus granulosus]EUB55273.1 hypothetical protein EGR_09874 [Echinococcus granulosus]